MAEEFINLREFDGFAASMRNDFRSLSEQVVQIDTKINMLMQVRVEEARIMGEITSTIKAINARLDGQDLGLASIRGEIDSLWEEHANIAKSKLGWIGQLVALAVAAAVGALFSSKR
jgi:hypothetical protein